MEKKALPAVAGLILLVSAGLGVCAEPGFAHDDARPAQQPGVAHVTEGKPAHRPWALTSDDCAQVSKRLREHPEPTNTWTSCTHTGKLRSGATAIPKAVSGSAAQSGHAFWCEDDSHGEWLLTREAMCIAKVPILFDLYNEKGESIGTADFVIRDQIEMSPSSPDLEGYEDIQMVDFTGLASGLTVSWQVNCNFCDGPAGPGTGNVQNAWQGSEPIGKGQRIDGSVGFTYAHPEGINGGRLFETVNIDKPGATKTSPPSQWASYAIRCDAQVPAYTGCVVPDFTPTFEVRSDTFGASAAMIRWAQQNLSGHWGLEGQGQPLHRIADEGQADANRQVICDSTFAAANPPVETDSCDEYPFAQSEESGARNGVTTGAQCAQVAAQRDSRVSDSDPLQLRWPTVASKAPTTGAEKCVRGNIPKLLNTGVGGELGRFVQKTHLLNGEAYWVYGG